MKITSKTVSHNEKKVFVALSGGVDSAVSAHLLKERGYDVSGIYMKNWSGEDYGLEDECPWKEDQRDAEAVCKHLEIPFKTYNFEKEYRDSVIEDFFEEYRKGRTPNPDILCNKMIKFGYFLNRALEEKADYIATGHYAGKAVNEDNTIDLITPRDQSKDQTYFLYRTTQAQLRHTLFPLTTIEKNEVRRIAQKVQLPVAEKKDSQGICFLGKVDVHDFLMKEIPSKKGDIVDIDTRKTIGRHDGVWYYTNGQREGLGIGGAEAPYYVCGKNIKKNELYVAQGHNHPALYTQNVTIGEIHWINETFSGGALSASLRYRQRPIPAQLAGNSLELEEPAWIPSTGQSAVLYLGDVVLGGAVIEKIESRSGG